MYWMRTFFPTITHQYLRHACYSAKWNPLCIIPLQEVGNGSPQVPLLLLVRFVFTLFLLIFVLQTVYMSSLEGPFATFLRLSCLRTIINIKMKVTSNIIIYPFRETKYPNIVQNVLLLRIGYQMHLNRNKE